MNELTEAPSPTSTTSATAPDLLEQYGCGPIRFSGHNDALYERHLLFDDVIDPLAAKGLPIARAVANTPVLAVLVIVVMLSRRPAAVIFIMLGLAATVASFPLSGDWSPVSATMLRRG